jgi:transcriptional regulator with XRE-family HTH domain
MNDEERTVLGNKLREAREYRGFSQEDIAKYLGIPRSAISLIENGSRRLDVLELQKLARLYKCSLDELTGNQSLGNHRDNSLGMVARATENLSSEDIAEVLRFAQFLKSKSAEGGR